MLKRLSRMIWDHCGCGWRDLTPTVRWVRQNKQHYNTFNETQAIVASHVWMADCIKQCVCLAPKLNAEIFLFMVLICGSIVVVGVCSEVVHNFSLQFNNLFHHHTKFLVRLGHSVEFLTTGLCFCDLLLSSLFFILTQDVPSHNKRIGGVSTFDGGFAKF